MLFESYIVILFAAAVLSAAVCLMAWKRMPSQGATPLVVLLASVSVWAFFQALSFIMIDLDVKVILANMRYFGIEAAPIAFYVLAREYEDRKRNFSFKRWLIILSFPLLCIITIWTNQFHHIFYLSVSIDRGILFLENGPLFWINMVYLYFFIVAGVLLFVRACLKSISIYRKQAVFIAASAIFPAIANLTFNFGLLPFENIDITPLTFLISGLLFFYALFQFQLLDVIPVARDRLMEEMEDIVIVIDRLKRIVDLNRKAKDLIVFSNPKSSDCIGKSIFDVFSWKELTDLLKGSVGVNERITYQNVQGTEYYHLRISRINDKNGNESGELIVLRNITELEIALLEAKKANDEAVCAKVEAENANKAKGYFLANMSHEIRTPLNGVIGIAEILNAEDLTIDKQKHYFGIILNSAQLLLTIINDILDFSKIEAGKMELEKSRLNIRNTVIDTVEAFQVSAANKSITLTPIVDERLDDNLIGDSVRIRQILTNLIGNAIKFTDKGQVNVSVEQVERDDKWVSVKIIVGDNGLGIPQDKLGTIFESFKQVDSSTTRKFGGTGLGLSIVKNLVELMNGCINVESELGKGSRFICNIPFELETKSDEIKRNDSENMEGIKLSELKVLVAEDNKVNREVVGMHLKKMGCIFDFAENGLIACEKLEKNKYDLVLMDVQMPIMDGIEATQIIRAKERNSGEHTVIIALTAGAMKDDIDKCLTAGMDFHISKPIKVQILHEILIRYAVELRNNKC